MSTIGPLVRRYKVHGIVCEKRGAVERPTSLIFSHGIEAGIDNGMTLHVAEGFAAYSSGGGHNGGGSSSSSSSSSGHGGPIVCWDGTRSLSERVASFHSVIAHESVGNNESGSGNERGGNETPAIGGRSMGARAAVLATQERRERGIKDRALVLISWPLFAGKNGERREPERREHILTNLAASTDVLFIIGTEDPQCPLQVFADFRTGMKANCWLVEVQGANHRMELSPSHAERPMRMMTGQLAAEWLESHDETKRHGRLAWNELSQTVDWSGWGDV